jgi:lysophospholipase L1-like esterase
MNARWPRLTRGAAWLAAASLTVLVLTEVVCRAVLGLGTPPLYESDAGFEYRLRPNQDVQRFGNHIVVNRWGMRAINFSEHKTHPNELRVMVFGDSVVNGGSQIDQSELSTSLLQTSLQNRLGRLVTVGNISAGSWGPGNWLAYAERFGFFDADVVVLVLGSGDHSDNPAFAPLGASHPTQTPTLALQEAVQRYLPRYLPEPLRDLLTERTASAAELGPADSARGLADLEQFLRNARVENRTVIVVHHPDRDELDSGVYLDGHAQIRALVQSVSLHFVELSTAFSAAGPGIYRDNIHHTAQGQRVLAEALFDAVLQVPPMLTPDTATVAAGERS